MFKILVVEDDRELNRAVCAFLGRNGYEAVGCLCAEEAYDALYETVFDLIISDIMMPGTDGFEFARTVREQNTELPILFMTARDDLTAKQRGFSAGADDYMTKPFNILEVKARIKSIFRRSQPQAEVHEEKRVIRVHDLEVNCQNRTVVLGGQPVRLTAKEFDLLQLLITHRGKVYSREALLETVWKYDYMGDMRTVDVHIRRLREKIERDSAGPEFILTKWGVGYYFTDKD